MSQSNDGAALGAVSFLSIVAYVLGGMHYQSAIGAIIGSFFFLTLPSNVHGFKSFLLWIVSIGCGYFSGYWIAVRWDDAAGGIAAVVFGAFGSTILTVVQKYLDGGPMPDFLRNILDRVPFLKDKRGSTDA